MTGHFQKPGNRGLLRLTALWPLLACALLVPAQAATPGKLLDGLPLLVRYSDITPDPEESLQELPLSLTNTSAKTITRVTMRLIYCDASGDVVKEWTTRRQLDQPLKPKETIQLLQPAYFMPLITRHTKVRIMEIRFSDGTACTPERAAFFPK